MYTSVLVDCTAIADRLHSSRRIERCTLQALVELTENGVVIWEPDETTVGEYHLAAIGETPGKSGRERLVAFL